MPSDFNQMLRKHQARLGWRQKEVRLWIGGIPLGTFQSWIKEQSKPPKWAQFLVEERLKAAKPNSMDYTRPSARQERLNVKKRGEEIAPVGS